MPRFLLLAILMATVSACGLKGPLYHPDEKPPRSSSKPQSTAPATQSQIP